MIVLVLISYVLTFFTRYNLRSDDLNVYIPYIQSLWDGERLGSQYDYQGFYWILSIYNKLFYHFFPNSSILAIGLIVTSTTIVLFILLWFTFWIIKKWIKSNQLGSTLLYLTIVLYTLSQFWFIVYPSYGNTFRRLSGVWLLVALAYYYKNKQWKMIYFMAFAFLALVNFSSTGIFLSFFLLYGLSQLFAFTDESQMWQKLWVLSIPFSIWSILYDNRFILIVLIFHGVLSFLLITQKIEWLNRFWKRIHNYVLVLVPITFFLLTSALPHIFSTYQPWLNFFTNPEYEMLIHYLRFDFSNLRFAMLSSVNIIFWLSMLFALFNLKRIQNRSHQAFMYLILVLLFTFFNPFVARFVISNLTNLAYFRIYDILFNPFSLFIYFYTVISLIKNKLFNKISYFFILFSLLLGTYTSDVFIYLDFSNNLDRIHHVDKNQLEVLSQLKSYIQNEGIEEPINIIVQIHAAHILTDMKIVRQTSQRIDNLDQLFADDSTGAKLNQIFYIKSGEDFPYTPPFSETCKLTKEVNTQFVIVEAQYNWDVENGLGYCAEKIFEVDDYRVYRMRFEWLNN